MNALRAEAKSALGPLGLFSNDRHILSVAVADYQLECELTHLDQLACAFDRLEVTCDSLQSSSLQQLTQLAEKLAARLTYLLEPIKTIEVDSQNVVVQMRSNPPQKNDDGTFYYELNVRQGGVLSLRRFHKVAGSPRATVAAEVTREVFLRLVDDFSSLA
ncbi:MAG: hypothetical protein SGJ20_21670 [Planctomycetota bacterium]|nr:hypothetical protein [Planctomycetota bacterium]